MLIYERRDRGSGFRLKTLTVLMTATILATGGAVEAELAADCAVEADSDSLRELRIHISKTKACIDNLQNVLAGLQTDFETKESLRDVAEADSTQREDAEREFKAAKSKLDATRGILSEAEQTLENDMNERDFRDLSFNTGVAVLRESGPDGSNETETMISMHQLLRTWNDKSVGLGPFIAISAEGDVADLIGVGAVFSFRRENGAHPLSVGAGYIIDRFGFEGDDGSRLGDRSGLFFVVSFNPAMSGVNIFEDLFRIPD